ncbi:MAG: hypothetical protein ACI802_002946 [Candidatus Paceibacteria bacterium]|jgi:hypothetical protein
MKSLKIAIVCTVRNPSPSFTTWIHHHSQLVDRLYIYLDNPTETDFSAIPATPMICTFSGARVSDFSGPSGVMQRQCKNVLHALSKCDVDGIDWLIHIDSDELIFSPEQRLESYFSRLDSEVSCIRFVNHEVVSKFVAEDPFKELTIFKKNQRSTTLENESLFQEYPYFLGYTIGKSAVRVEKCIGPSGVHEFEMISGQIVWEEKICILHYMSATYNDWLKKCAELDTFKSFWFDDFQRPMYDSFLVMSRDIYLSAKQSGDWSIASDFYNQFSIPESDIKKFLKNGRLVNFDVFSELG